MSKLLIRDMATNDQPRYRAKQNGTGALSNAELLQLICRNHSLEENTELMALAETLKGLSLLSTQQVAAIDGLGEGSALAIQAALELGRRRILESPEDKVSVRSPADVAQILMAQFSHLEQEHFITLLLDSRNRIIKTHVVYIGTKNSCEIRLSEVFKEAIRSNAATMIIAHNHPSGDPTPSPEDVALTRQVVEAGKLLNIDIMDHVIVGDQRFVSLRERGLGFS